MYSLRRGRGHSGYLDSAFCLNESGLARSLNFINDSNSLLHIEWKDARQIAWRTAFGDRFNSEGCYELDRKHDRVQCRSHFGTQLPPVVFMAVKKVACLNNIKKPTQH